MQAKIYEQGNGFPDWSDLVADLDGNLYRITGEGSVIHTDTTGGGGANWIECEVAVADWSEVTSDVEPFPALCVPLYMERPNV